ncbi:MAG: VTT domain-containing protein [Robiginitomaculum sp.]|nr:VTT domain-containing protein [Robiginitomaculum sp.]
MHMSQKSDTIAHFKVKNGVFMEFIGESNMYLLYIGLFLAPFVQEDSAVIGAASLSISRSDHWISIFAVILIGLIASDSWKYWLGWAGKHHKWAKKYTQNERVQKLKHVIINNSVKTLIAVRFLPLARIPTYLATGFFGVPYLKYWLSIAVSALIYVTVIFCAFHVLGEIMGEKLKTYMPFFAVGILIATLIGYFIYRKTKKL